MQYSRLFKAATHPVQDAFLRIDVQPRSWTEPVRGHCSFSRPELRTLSSDARLPSLSEKSRRAALPCALLARLAAHLDSKGKMLLTDICNRHSIRAPEYRSTPEPAALAAMTASMMSQEREPLCHPEHGVRPPFGNPTPGGAALDGASPAADVSPASLPSFIEEETSPAWKRRFPAAAFSAADRAGDPASDAPVAPRVYLFPGFHRAPESLLPPSRQRERLPRSEAPSINKCSLTRLRGGSPPPSP